MHHPNHNNINSNVTYCNSCPCCAQKKNNCSLPWHPLFSPRYSSNLIGHLTQGLCAHLLPSTQGWNIPKRIFCCPVLLDLMNVLNLQPCNLEYTNSWMPKRAWRIFGLLFWKKLDFAKVSIYCAFAELLLRTLFLNYWPQKASIVSREFNQLALLSLSALFLASFTLTFFLYLFNFVYGEMINLLCCCMFVLKIKKMCWFLTWQRFLELSPQIQATG